jgi:hypothetical protein
MAAWSVVAAREITRSERNWNTAIIIPAALSREEGAFFVRLLRRTVSRLLSGRVRIRSVEAHLIGLMR